MTSEDNSSYDQEHITEERSFDQLAKGLSMAPSREAKRSSCWEQRS